MTMTVKKLSVSRSIPSVDSFSWFTRQWLAAWSAKDVAGVLAHYTNDCIYRDPQTADTIQGHEAIGAYLTKLFASQPNVTYTPHQLWTTPDGYCGRWYALIEAPTGPVHMRGFDLCVMRDGLICHNEVYVHMLKELPEEAK